MPESLRTVSTIYKEQILMNWIEMSWARHTIIKIVQNGVGKTARF